MHSRSRITIDPRIPAMPRRSTSGFRRPGRHCLHPAPSAVRYWASHMKRDLPLEVKGRGEERGGYVGHADLEGKKKKKDETERVSR